MQHLIIGRGEIGQAIAEVLKKTAQEVFFYDIDPDRCDIINGVEFGAMHVCHGFDHENPDKFVKDVIKYTKEFKPDIVIVHSTVMPGTSDRIAPACQKYTYSPVRGRHKNTLVDHILKFTKFYCSNGYAADVKFKRIFHNLDLREAPDYRSLETAKIMCTTYMYWCLMFEKELKRFCDGEGLDFEFVYRTWNRTYNNACNGHIFPHRFARPIYDDMPGPIGGHCLAPNINLVTNEITKILRHYDDMLEDEWYSGSRVE